MANKTYGKSTAIADVVKNLQFGALPYQVNRRGIVRILLVTSRETGRWIIPKGWPMEGRMPHEAAAIEAFEEAGVVGDPMSVAIGTYVYWKRFETVSKFCEVEVYPLPIDHLEVHWPEDAQRERKLFAVENAAALVDEPSLKRLLTSFRVTEEINT